jgi:hypothetical protein
MSLPEKSEPRSSFQKGRSMYEAELSPVSGGTKPRSPVNAGHISVAERELLTFIDSVTDLFGPGQTKVLTEIWLDALASMDRMPDPESPD